MRRTTAVAAAAATLIAGCGASEQRRAPADPGERFAEPRPADGSHRAGTVTGSRGCPRTAGGRRAPRVAIALGDGPAFPVLGMEEAPPSPRGVSVLEGEARRGRLYAQKTLWALSPDTPRDLMVRASRRSTGERVRFLDADGRGAIDELPLGGSSGRWEYAATATLLPGPGCYVFRVTGTGVDDLIVFRAVSPQAWRPSARSGGGCRAGCRRGRRRTPACRRRCR